MAASAFRPFRRACTRYWGRVRCTHTSRGRAGPWGSNPDPRTTFSDTAKDVLFDMFKGPDDTVAIGKFLSSLSALGLRHSDPRLKEMKQRLMDVVSPDDLVLDILDYSPVRDPLTAVPPAAPSCGTRVTAACLNRLEFGRVVESSMPLLSRAFRGRLAVADFDEFCSRLRCIFERCRDNDDGHVAAYIPQLALMDRNRWGASVCSVDGQRFCVGDARVPFTMQSIRRGSSKPLTYALCLEHLGADVVHRYVGQEPSGRNFNELVLDSNKRPHNPMVNSGAIVLCSLLQDLIHPGMTAAQKFEFTFNFNQRMAGEEKLGFNNAVFVSERDAGDRNYALAFLMREHHCYPGRTRLRTVMDLYFQCCAMETTADSLAVIGATLANGGVCPLTDERVLRGEPVRDALSLMHSCGMYDYSGEFAFKVGIPAKSGVSGGLLAVVPNLLGLACWSPALDKLGNTARGVQFCEEVVAEFGFHPYSGIRNGGTSWRRRRSSPWSPYGVDREESAEWRRAQLVTSLMLAAKDGDVAGLRSHLLAGHDVNVTDYDGRTVLHVAAAEGHADAVHLLLERCAFLTTARDRWGHLPLDDARRFGHDEVAAALEKYAAEAEP